MVWIGNIVGILIPIYVLSIMHATSLSNFFILWQINVGDTCVCDYLLNSKW